MKQKPCPPLKCISWFLAPVEFCLVHTVDLISPKGGGGNRNKNVGKQRITSGNRTTGKR